MIIATSADGEHYDCCKVTVLDKSVKSYSIKYQLNGAKTYSNASNPDRYFAGETITLVAPSQKGMIFDGWYFDSKFKKPATGISSTDTGTKKFYAKWKNVGYSIEYDLNGGTLKKKNRTSYDIKTSTFSLNNPKRTGYKFLGWYDEDGNRVKKFIKGSVGDISLTAEWEPVVYKITYALKGGKLYEDVVTRYTIEDSVSLPIPVKDGYFFEGWKLKKNFVTEIPEGTTGNITVTAVWSKLK